ncbi:hypothetical protein C8A05DRAFT_35584 [Staphylotrichum tortipilum]|uniref:Malate dehydrogenase n=1 Tax=Staphylotrichum tortipilum TaxID=2831512 RepID=A0AAN6MH57_9PEZI|nr:hypothetical protein C8A05DRAFT_35584 [Staphylotrichum longicolle]
MVSTTLVFAALVAAVSAVPACRPPTYTLPKLGAETELAAPAAGLVLRKIAIGHGIQNYTCKDTTSAPSANGALAVLYDATLLYPGTKKTGLSQAAWDNAPSTVLRHTALPLNKLAGSEYGADATNPFPPAADLKPGQGLPALKFLGHHFFDIDGVPVFDLTAAGLKATVHKITALNAPATADKGITGTGAVAWLQLDDTGAGLSKGVTTVYRVITAGGAGKACSVAGVGPQSVPYTTYYWFFG